MPNELSKYIRQKLGHDGDAEELRHAVGDAIEKFKSDCGRGGADNIGFSKNGIWLVDADTGRIVGTVSEILMLVVME